MEEKKKETQKKNEERLPQNCPFCGAPLQPNGTCWVCPCCGTTTGCS